MDAQKFVGLPEIEARKLAAQAGLQVSTTPGAATMLTNSMQMNRLTLQIENGVVVSAKIG